MWFHIWVHTPYVKACVIAAHFSRTVWKQIHTPYPPPSFFISPSFSILLPPLCLCPWWPSCLGGLSDRADPCAWAEVNLLMVSILLLLWQAFLRSADVSWCSCRGRVDWGELVCVSVCVCVCVSVERGDMWNIWEYLCTSSAAWRLVDTSVETQVCSTAVQHKYTDAALGHWHTYQSMH